MVRQIDKILYREGIKNYDVPIQEQSTSWLLREFGGGKKHPIQVSLLIKNLIWQNRQSIMAKETKPILGLIRNFWYSHIKPTLARTNSLNPKYDQYNQLIQELYDMVVSNDLMRYRNMGFVDDNQNSRSIGAVPNVILFAEKDGHYPLLQEIAKEHDLTIISLGGQPSALSVEYFVDEMRAKNINLQQTFYLFSLVDYDTSGSIIRNAFVRDLKFYGVSHVRVADIALPSRLPAEQVEINKYPLPNRPEMRKKNKKWLEATGGINGQLFGLESDVFQPEWVKQFLRSELKDILSQSEEKRMVSKLQELAELLDQYVAVKAREERQHPAKTPKTNERSLQNAAIS